MLNYRAIAVSLWPLLLSYDDLVRTVDEPFFDDILDKNSLLTDAHRHSSSDKGNVAATPVPPARILTSDNYLWHTSYKSAV